MKAGAGKAEIILTDEYLEIENFTVIHGALNARAVAVESGETIVWLSVEVTSLPEEEVEAIRFGLNNRFRGREMHVWVCVTHTFSAPHLLPDAVLGEEDKIRQKAGYREAILRACEEAAGQAVSSMQPVTISFGKGLCDINRNRDVQLPDGWWIGEGSRGLTDHTVSVIRLNREDDSPLAILFYYGVQSSVLDGSELSAGGRAVTSDLAGAASAYIEKKYRDYGTIGLFLLGAAGDQCPMEKTVYETFVQGERIRRDRHEEGFAICEALGDRLGEEVCCIAGNAGSVAAENMILYGKTSFRVPGKEMERDLKKLHPVRKASYVPAADRETQVEAVGIGEIAFVGVKPELNCCSAVALRACSPFQNTLVCTMVNGASKYMADRESYDRFTYEAMNSPFGKGAAERLVQESLTLLKNMKEEETHGKT